MKVWHKAWLAFAMLALMVPALNGCDAGPSAVLPDGAGVSPSSQSQSAGEGTAGAVATAGIEEASMPVADAVPGIPDLELHAEAPNNGTALALPGGARAAITATQYGDWPLWSKNRKYSADDNAHYHFGKHGAEFGAKSYADYVAMVHGFIHNPPLGTQTLKRSNGDTLLYDPKGNVFAVMTKAGAPRTLFRPDNGAAYWQQQKQIESQRRTPRRESYGEE